MATPLINGVSYSWANIKLILFGVPIVGITKISYKIKQKKENNYGAGYAPVSRGYGNIEYEGNIEIYQEELKRIIASSPNKNLMAIPPFDIQIVFENGESNFLGTDILQKCEFTEEGLDASQGDTKLMVSLPLIIGSITHK